MKIKRACAAVAVLLSAVVLLPAAENPGLKEFHMFVGADLFVVKDLQPYPVVYAEGQILDVKIGQELKHLNIRDVKSLRATPNLKLTRSYATISTYKQEQGFSAANDPLLKWAHDMNVSAELSFAATNAAAPKFNPFNDLQAGVAANLAARGLPGAPVAAPSSTPVPNAPSIPSGLTESSTGNLASENYDVLRVNFQLSSPRRIPDPYLAIIADITDPAKPGETFRWFYIDTLKDIDEKPQKIRVSAAGFPPGFKVLDTSVHIYSRGQEVATNQAKSRHEMSLDEAHEYLTIQHLASHKGATLPPSLSLAELPADFHMRATPNQLKQTLEIKVDASGRATAVTSQADAAEIPFDAYLAGAVKNFRFNPALDQGRPIEGKLTAKLSELVAPR
ncbi:MAG TPA: hypothetical protein VHO24_19940 [Opitutaceae bacterium]|nr:hypothetical protein [Opitutaceae bacterium]